jgi:putative spermidine/putrescine transport system ATP-binding protein
MQLMIKENSKYEVAKKQHHEAHSLRLKEVSKAFGSIQAVDNVSLSIKHGAFLTLLGPSGSGKTTILMMIAGFYKPTEGEIFLDEKPIIHLHPEKRNFGMVFQGYALFPHKSVYDNIAFPLKMRHLPAKEINKRVNGVLGLLQLNGLAKRLPRMLSGGQQQRVALARAIVFKPDILLLDEPLGALDRKLRADVQVELKLLHQRVGMTFVYVTHDQEEALSMSSQIAIMRNGRLVQVGDPEELYERPKTRFVAGFLGKSNFIRGVVTEINHDGITYRVEQKIFRHSENISNIRPGDDILIAIRPEKIMITEKAIENVANQVAGEIMNWSYFGSTFQIIIRTETFGNLTIDLPSWRCSVEPSNGRRIWINWARDASVFIKDE